MKQALPLVLLIEDDNDISDLYQSVLMSDHLQVIPFKNGAKARDWLADSGHQPDLMIIDVRLPDVNGLDLCKEFVAYPSWRDKPPVLMLSAHGDPRLPVRCREAGASEFLNKLVGLDLFRNTVMRLLQPAVQSRTAVSV